ncbi:MAG TPA: EamA family transporter [Longimicrobiales bacterium]
MPEPVLRERPSTAKVVAAFAAVYTIWGSTYLAILYAIETLPPFLMAGVRFVIAGSVLYAWAWLRGARRPVTLLHWKSALVVGGLLLLGGNGAVVWAEQRVASGLAALLVATVPLWMVLLDWLRPAGVPPDRRTAAGIVIGLAGLALLVGPESLLGGGRVDPLGAGVLVAGSLSWAAGSLYARGARLPDSALLATAMEMLAGGALLVLVGALTGEVGRLDPGAVSARSLLGLLYLIVFGSLVGFTAYTWLLGVSTPARVSTYAYVNPVVAVLLGWALAGEPLTPRMALAAAVIVAAVAAITGRRATRGEPAMERPETAACAARPEPGAGDVAPSPLARPDPTDAGPPTPRPRVAGER